MINLDAKLKVLSKLASYFNKEELTWAVGASVLLYFKGYVDNFHDLDIMVEDKDSLKMEVILNNLGVLQPSEKGNFKTKHFRKYIVDDVEIDMIGGFVIVSDNKEYDCDINESQIESYVTINEQKIPLHSVSLWKEYYRLMGRTEKVMIIERGC